MKGVDTFFKTYFILMIVYSVFGIFNSILRLLGYGDFIEENPFLMFIGVLFTLLSLAIFVLSIIALIRFIKGNLPKLTLIVPIVVLGVFVIGLFFGIFVAISGSFAILELLLFVDLFSCLFILPFSIDVLSRFK
ncbi:MAG: hypothetical protein ACOCQG_03695 [Candidatus Nanoarchaeia archaeon]